MRCSVPSVARVDRRLCVIRLRWCVTPPPAKTAAAAAGCVVVTFAAAAVVFVVVILAAAAVVFVVVTFAAAAVVACDAAITRGTISVITPPIHSDDGRGAHGGTGACDIRNTVVSGVFDVAACACASHSRRCHRGRCSSAIIATIAADGDIAITIAADGDIAITIAAFIVVFVVADVAGVTVVSFEIAATAAVVVVVTVSASFA